MPEKPQRRVDRGGLIVGAVALLGTLAVIAVGGGGYLAYQKLSATATFNAQGWLILRNSDTLTEAYSTSGTACQGVNGYDDIAEGASVVVRNADGKTVATGALEAGQADNAKCSFPITVMAIPDGSKFYSFEVSHRGQVTMVRDQAEHPVLTVGH